MTEVDCPICGKRVPWVAESRWRPFCSERCKLIDLGDWAAGRHVIAGAPSDVSAAGADAGDRKAPPSPGGR
jgi:endogenous inhibitor of DNA gyrase (YacG/DUF329 family)